MFKLNKELKYITSTLINHSGIQAGFGTRQFIVNSLPNKVPTYRFNQVHGNNVVWIEKDSSELIPDADGGISHADELCMLIRTADCVPIIYADHQKGIIAISHNGWRGTVLNISKKVVNEMLAQGALLKHITVAIGPSIGPCCYKIFGERYRIFLNTYPKHMESVCNEYLTHKGLNLGLLNRYLLLEAGIQENNIDFSCYCTSCDESKFYSYNRDRTTASMYSFVMKYDYNR